MWSRAGSNEITDGSVGGCYTYGTQTVFRVFVGTQDVVSRTDKELGRGLSTTGKRGQVQLLKK